MSVVQPIAQSVPAFDARNSNTFKFVSNGGNQVVANRLVIRNNDTNKEIYNKKIESYKFEHTISGNVLENGIYYNFYFRTYDINDNESPISNVIPFRCYTTPTLRITNIPSSGIVESTNIKINATYDQEQKELIDFAKFILYDSQNNVLFETENIYNTETPPITLTYTFTGLKNDTTYKVSAKVITINRTVVESEKEIFTTRYYEPSMFSVIELENNCNEGYVKIKNNFKSVDSESNPPNIGENPKYLKDGKLYLTEDGTYIRWFSSYNIKKDFTLKFFIENPNLGDLCIIQNGNNEKIVISLIQDYPYGENSKKYCLQLQCFSNLENPYIIYSNYISNKEKLIMWVRRINSIFEARLEDNR